MAGGSSPRLVRGGLSDLEHRRVETVPNGGAVIIEPPPEFTPEGEVGAVVVTTPVATVVDVGDDRQAVAVDGDGADAIVQGEDQRRDLAGLAVDVPPSSQWSRVAAGPGTARDAPPRLRRRSTGSVQLPSTAQTPVNGKAAGER